MAHPPVDSLILEVTRRCNHACLHCYNVWKNARPYPAGELPAAELIALLGRVLDETGASLVTLTGGEPLLRADLPELVDFLAGRGARVNLITNGTLLDAAALDRLVPGKIDVFEVPLLSSEAAIHDHLSGSAGAFDRVTEAIADLKLAGQRVVGVFVATRLNLHTWRDTIELGVALGLDGIMLNRFNPGGAGLGNLELLQAAPGELRDALDVAEELAEAYDISIGCSIAMPPCLFDTSRYRRLSFGFCAAGTSRAYTTIDPAGNVRPCNHSPAVLGNLRSPAARLGELLESEALREFVAARPAFCAGCRLEETCLGGCKAAAEACYGSARELEPFLRAHQALARPLR